MSSEEIRVYYKTKQQFFAKGKTIAKTWIDPEHTIVKLQFTDSTIAYLVTEGDCCSETWIEHISNIDRAIGAVIISTEKKEICEVIPTRQERDLLYSASIFCEFQRPYKCNGSIDIEFRNSSNGYYGGDIYWIDEECFKDVFDQNRDWKPLKEDF